MTIRHLRIFAAVVDCGTMHAAAQKLYLSQPTITQAVKELEEHYGCLLFERYGRRLMITPAGQELLGHAREVLAVCDTAAADKANSYICHWNSPPKFTPKSIRTPNDLFLLVF